MEIFLRALRTRPQRYLTHHTASVATKALRISAYTAEPGTPSEGALNLMASRAATLDQAKTAHATVDLNPRGRPWQPIPHADHRSWHHVVTGLRLARSEDATPRREVVPEPVTKQVTRPPGDDRRSATYPDTDIHLTCGKPTQCNAVRRNRHAW